MQRPKCVSTLTFLTLRTAAVGIALVAIAAAPESAAGQVTPTATTHRTAVERTLASAALGQERTFNVHLPASYSRRAEQQYPVLYLLDGEDNTAFSVAVADFLSDNGVIPEMIIVALPSGATRSVDYLPEFASMGSDPGGADRFLRYLADEVVPLVDDTYRTAPLRLLAGHSLGGTFVTYALATRPAAFQAYLAQSPYTAGEIGDPLIAQLESTLGSGDVAAFYFMNLGDEPDLLANFDRVESLLQATNARGFDYAVVREPGKTHMTTRLVGMYEGLESFFGPHWAIDQATLATEGPAGLVAHLDALAARYGYPVVVGEATFQAAAQTALGRRDLPAAVGFGRLYAEHYESAPTAHFLLGVALAQSGEIAAAAGEIDLAIELYEANPDPALAGMYQTMKQVQQQLATRGTGNE